MNYTIFHIHSDFSSATTNIDSVTKYTEYIEAAQKCGMKALAFSEHGNIYGWYNKKKKIEAAGMKYIHACECYVSENLDKMRDNYHCVLIAKNFDGFKELNNLISHSFDRTDGHFYYAPRISFEELTKTSDNIVITTACLGGILNRGGDELQQRFIDFLHANKHRCFLEIQHHNDVKGEQAQYNQKLYALSIKYNIPLIAGTDTHSLNEDQSEARKMLQQGKGVFFTEEEDWDLTFKTYDELCAAYKLQNALPEQVYREAIENTNVMAEMIEPFTLDKHTKYPKIYKDSLQTFKSKIDDSYKKHRYVRKRYTRQEVLDTVLSELEVYQATDSIDFMLLQQYLREWEKQNGILCGYSRGSVSGSFIAYILGITNMDSKKFNLNFFRFLNPHRVTNADIDTDYSSVDRDKVKEFILKDKMNLSNIQTAEIITFNTVKMKGAIKEIGRALGMSIQETQNISNAVIDNTIDDSYRKKYPSLFKYVDLVMDVIVSVGTHPSGVLISDKNIAELIGLCTLSKSKYPVSMLNMKELDELMYVKLDILGLDNIGVINETCRLAGIKRLTPDNVNLEDEKVWQSIRDDTTMIFQWESDSAQAYLKKFMSEETLKFAKERVKNFSYIKWFSFGNGLLRPACASYRDSVAKGEFYDNGFAELNEFLAPTMGHVTMQEDIMQFLVKFCGYTEAESDTVRRGIAKKVGTEDLLPEIENRFITYTSQHYNVDKAKCQQIIKPFLQVILEASKYAFSWNHSDAYSCVGYICGYLRYYYTYEFLTAALNIFASDEEKTKNIIEYAKKNTISIQNIKFRFSKSDYVYDKDTKTIYKGIASIKHLNKKIADELYQLRKNPYTSFREVLVDIFNLTSVDTKQLEILIKLDFFSEFGEIKELLEQKGIFEMWYGRKSLKRDVAYQMGITDEMIKKIEGRKTEKTIQNIDSLKLIELICQNRSYEKTSLIDKINFEKECLGYITIKIDSISSLYGYVTKLHDKYANKTIEIYRLNTGEIEVFKIKSKQYNNNPISEGMIIKTIEMGEEKKWRKDNDGKWIQIDELEKILYKWSIVKC